jgi:hypothetical protein
MWWLSNVFLSQLEKANLIFLLNKKRGYKNREKKIKEIEFITMKNNKILIGTKIVVSAIHHHQIIQ